MLTEKDYFCPKCNEKMSRNFVIALREGSEGGKFADMTTLHMAFNILADSRCPQNILESIREWIDGRSEVSISDEEMDKLKLLKWNNTMSQ